MNDERAGSERSWAPLRRGSEREEQPMDRGSVQHGPRIDEEMAEEVDALTRGAPVEARSHEDREAEPPVAGEVDGGEERSDFERRSEIARHLRPSAFPADSATLLRVAGEAHAPDAVLTALARLPADRTFETPADVWTALGGVMETRESVGDAPVPTPEPEPQVQLDAEREEHITRFLVEVGRAAVAGGMERLADVLERCARSLRGESEET